MTYAIIDCVNGVYKVRSEGIATPEAAKIQFHDRCKVLWNAPDVEKAMVMIADENLDAMEGYKEFISHPVETENEPE